MKLNRPATWVVLFVLAFPSSGVGKDYLLTIGGGYASTANQASIEANVLFFQEVLRQRHSSPFEHRIHFADGFSDKADVQILLAKPKDSSPAIELLNTIFDRNRDQLAYRDHRVPDIQGPIDPAGIKMSIEEVAKKIAEGDRLIVYVTAHGSEAKGKDQFNTSITCWDKKVLSMHTFSDWLDLFPKTVPIVMVMAQCYCGGFANTIFVGGESENGLSDRVRVGFFAQRHDLPAAGCRPDVENDEEYSSYFWGALMGQTRSGRPVELADCNGDGRVSFAEAHAYAVVECQTIDIPLKSSEAFLRKFSRIAGYDSEPTEFSEEVTVNAPTDSRLRYLTGNLESISLLGTSDQRKIVLGLAKQLNLPLSSDISEVFLQSQNQYEQYRQSRRSGRRGRSSSRRVLRSELIAKWPELEATERWATLDFLAPGASDAFLDQVKELPGYEFYRKTQEDRRKATELRIKAELRHIQFRRLVYALETIVYEHNLPFVASQNELEKYKSMRAMEDTFFDAPAR